MNITFVTLLSTPNYVNGVIVLNKSLKRHSDIPLLCVCSKSLPEDSIKTLQESEIECYRLSESALELAKVRGFLPVVYSYWMYTFDKLLIWGLTQYDKIVFLDADMLVCGYIDDLFHWPDMSAVNAGGFVHANWTQLNSGLMVIEPNKDVVNKLIGNIKSAIENSKLLQVGVGDQDVIHRVFPNWPSQKEKHIPYPYNLFFCDITTYFLNLKHLGNPKIIHFASSCKPWMKQSVKISIEQVMSMLKYNRFAIKYFVEYKMLQKGFL